MTTEEARAVIERTSAAWVLDERSAVVWSGEHEGRLGIRMCQSSRDYTTVWFAVGQRTVALEAYLLPAPQFGHAEVYRQALIRNWRSWPVHVAMDGDGNLCVVGRVPLEQFDESRLDEMVGAVHELVDIAFRPLVRAARREKSP